MQRRRNPGRAWRLAALLAVSAAASSAEPERFDTLAREYETGIRPLVAKYCLDCHSSAKQRGDLDLERFAGLDHVRRDPVVWQKIVEQLALGEMPPVKRPQPTATERERLSGWVTRYLAAEARTNAGDPGPVVLRRLNNAEYTYTIHDLTGVALDPARDFPVDGAAGEGFTNTGDALAMSPALVTKYLDAAKSIAAHAVLLPDGFRFSSSATRRDWTDEILAEIRAIHGRYTDLNGRVDLTPYLAALVEHRGTLAASLDGVDALADAQGLSATYLKQLVRALLSGSPSSFLGRISARLAEASPADAPALVAEIRAWQDWLWKHEPVGHFGMIRPWQLPVSPLVGSREFRLEIEDAADGGDVVLHLTASTPPGGEGSVVVWDEPRLQRAGRPPLLLRDARAASGALSVARERMLAAVPAYLAAAFASRTTALDIDTAELAARHGVEPVLLRAWLSYLGVSPAGDVEIDEYLHGRTSNGGGHAFVNGWGVPGVGDLSLVSNASDQTVNIPGELKAHGVAVHPRPERWVAAGWRSPVNAQVQIVPHVRDAHSQCGNGVSWSLELQHRGRRRVLGAGDVELGQAARIEPFAGVLIAKGDLVSLVIDARDGSHVCDLTEIDLEIVEEVDDGREWALAGDCADSIHAGNPHSDRLGNQGVWHFYTGRSDGPPARQGIPHGSRLARWLDADDEVVAARLAGEVAALLGETPPANATAADRELRGQLTAPGGALLGRIDIAALLCMELAKNVPAVALGLEPQRFGRFPDGVATAPEDLVVEAPASVEVRLPAGWFDGWELTANASIAGAAETTAGVQVRAGVGTAPAIDALVPGDPILVARGSAAAAQLSRELDEFRQLFPAAVCYRPIVPVDEVVTLVLFHREDEHLARLLLDDGERARLDRLWRELRFVSQDALIMETGYEQLMAFATQDSDPRLFEPLREPVRQRAAMFRQQLEESELPHLDTVVELASRAYRRPPAAREVHGLRALYHSLRADDLPHDEALRLTLARVLVAPAFLYRLEEPGPGKEPTPVSDLELASRLSYFLWSSLPDAPLRAVAESGRLRDPGVLVEETHRLLRDPRARRFAIEFACQWLHIRDFDQLDEKSPRHFPTFAGLQGAMYEESIRFFTDLFQNGGSVLSILDADHTFVDGPLAAHYGIPGVEGPGWQRVDGVRRFARGGILAQATILAKQSGASRTSPILRGTWVSEVLLGEKLPRPPKDVPQLPDDATSTAGLTMRQLVEKHTSDPGCAKCHVRVDPFGFALEEFDAIGRFRREEPGGQPIDTSSKLPDGTEIAGLDGLRDYLLETRRETFVRQFCRKLLGYALGRAVRLSDAPLLDEMVAQLNENDYRFSVAVEEIVRSRQFREIRGRSFGTVAGAD